MLVLIITNIDDNDDDDDDYHCNVGPGMWCQACKVPPMVTCPNTQPTCIIDQYMCSVHSCIVKSAVHLVFSSVAYFGPNFSRWKLAAANLHQLQIPNLLHQPHKLPLRPLAWCYVLCHSHHKFPPEPSASDNCHSSAFSSPARASTSSSASLCHILSLPCTVHSMPPQYTICTFHNVHSAQYAPCTLSTFNTRSLWTIPHLIPLLIVNQPNPSHRALNWSQSIVSPTLIRIGY